MGSILALIDPSKAVTAFFVGVGIVVAFSTIRWMKALLNAKRKVSALEIDLALRQLHDAQNNLQLGDLIMRANEDMRKRDDSGDNSNSH